MNDKEILLETRNLKKSFNKLDVLKGINTKIYAVGVSSRLRHLKKVLFPQPEGPITAITSPA